MKLAYWRYVVMCLLLVTTVSAEAPAEESTGEVEIEEEVETEEEEEKPTIAEITEDSDRIDGLFTLFHDRNTGELRMQLDEEREVAEAAGQPIEYPITLRIGFDWDTRYYLSDRYTATKEGRHIVLNPKEDAE